MRLPLLAALALCAAPALHAEACRNKLTVTPSVNKQANASGYFYRASVLNDTTTPWKFELKAGGFPVGTNITAAQHGGPIGFDKSVRLDLGTGSSAQVGSNVTVLFDADPVPNKPWVRVLNCTK